MDGIALPAGAQYQEVWYAAGQPILSPLRGNDSLFILLQGVADVLYYGPEGETMRICRYTAPDLFGELEMLTGDPMPMPVVAVTDCWLLKLPHREALRLLEGDFSLCRALMKRLSEKLLRGMTGRIQLNCLTQRQRYLLAMEAHARA